MPPDDGVSEVPIDESEDVAMTINLNELLMGHQGQVLGQMRESYVFNADLLNKAATKKFAEVDLVEASAAKELGKAGENPRYQPQTSPAAG